MTPTQMLPELDPYVKTRQSFQGKSQKDKPDTLRVLLVSTDEMREEPVENLDLSQGSLNALKRAQILTIGELINRFNNVTSRNSIYVKPIAGLGKVKCTEVKSKLLDYMFDSMTEEQQVAYFEALNLINGGGLAYEVIKEEEETNDA